MTLAGWIIEYFKVFLVYLLLMFAWPSLIFGSFLKKKTWKYRLGFCAVFSIILINCVVMLLGLLHILNPVVVRVLFYGSIVVTAIVKIPNKKGMVKRGAMLVAGSYGFKQFIRNMSVNLRRSIMSLLWVIRKRFREHKLEYALIMVILAFGMLYFSYGNLQITSYGCGDMYTHNSWIYGLVNGKIYSGGIYPEGMHCFIYAMHVLFGIKLYSCMQFTGGIHMMLTLLSAYVFFREVFRSKYTPILALTLFLTVDCQCVDGVFGMARFQWTIPQEFGFFTIFISAAALIRFIKTEKQRFPKLIKIKRPSYYVETESRLIYNDELLVFGGAIAASAMIHFYDTGMALVLCLTIVPFAIHKIFNIKRLWPLILSVLLAFSVALLPIGLVYASGTEMQGSFDWAINIINDSLQTDSTEDMLAEGTSEAGEESNTDETGTEGSDGGSEAPGDSTEVSDSGAEAAVDGTEGSEGNLEITESGSGIGESGTSVSVSGGKTSSGAGFKSFIEKLKEMAEGVFTYGYATIYSNARAKQLVGITVFALLLFIAGKIGNIIYVRVKDKKSIGISLFDGYFILAASSVIFMIMYSAPNIGLPEFIAHGRLCGIEQFLLCAVTMIPADMILWALEHGLTGAQLAAITTVGIASVFINTLGTGSYHGYLYMEFTRLNSEVNVTESIVSTMDKNSYTIVSPVTELYQVEGYGYHEELVQFINNCVEKDYTLSTKYVFFYFEKKPIKYAQDQFFSGPSWIAQEKYMELFGDDARRYPNIISAVAGDDIATGVFYKYPVEASSYSDWLTRLVLESRLLLWVEDFNKLYPTELHVYYDDEYFTCYYFEQNPACLYQLGFEKGDSAADGD